MNEVEYILRIVLKARDELAVALRKAREELRLFANAADSNKAKIDGFNKSIAAMDKNVANITDKFREWRAIVEGTSGENEKARKSFGDLGKEVDVTARKQVAAARSQRDLVESARRLNNEVKELTQAEKDGNVSRDYAINQYKDLGRQLDLVSRKMNTGTRDSQRAFEWSQRSIKAADDIVKAKKNEAAAFEESEKRKLDAIRRNNELISRAIDDQIAREADAQKLRVANVKRGNDAIARDINAQIAREKKASDARIKQLKDENRAHEDAIKIERNVTSALTRLRAARERLGKGGLLGDIDTKEIRDVERHLNEASKGFDRTSRAARTLRAEAASLSGALRDNNREAERGNSIFNALGNAFSNNKESVASLDNQLRGIGWLAAFGFAQQLITVLGGLGGAFVAVASSAAEAGAAIGGSFVAGVGQALPSIGLLSAALFRVKSVMDVVQQAQLTQQQQAVQAATAGRRNADATDTLTNAQEGLSRSHEQLSDATKGLTDARKEARRDLQDLILAEKQADLAAKGAVLSQKDAQEALRQAISSGDTSGIGRAQLDVAQARADAEEKALAARRAHQEAARGQRTGPEGMEGVVQAKRQVEDAERAVQRANRGIDTAKRNASEAAAGTETAAAKLNFLMAQLSPAERRLYNAITQFQTLFRTGIYRNITDVIVSSFARAVERVTKIIQMPEVINLARRTAQQLARQINRVFDAFTSSDMIRQFVRIGEEGRKNLQPLTTIIIRLGRSLVNIAEEAGPALRLLIRFVGGLAAQIEKLTNNRAAMTQFFTEGERHFEAWVKLGIAVIRLFAALAGAGGARSGLRTINDATRALDGLTDKVHNNRKAVGQFFEDSRGVAHEVVRVLAALGVELFKAFSPDRVHDFAQILITVVIPAIGSAFELLGKLTNLLLDIAKNPAGREMLKFGFALFFVSKALSSTLGVLTGFIKGIQFFVELLAPLVRLVPGLSRVGAIIREFGVFRAVAFSTGFVGIAAAVVFLLAKLGLLDDAWREVKRAFNAFWREVQPSVKRLIDAFQDLWGAVGEGSGLFGTLARVLRPVLRVAIQIGGVFLRVFGRTLGRIIGGAIDTFTGFINFLTGVFTGDWRKAWQGIRQIFGGILRSMLAFIRAVPELIVDIARKIAPAFRRGVEGLWDWLKGLPKRLGNIAADAASSFVRAFKDVGKDVIKGIVTGLKDTGGFARDLANAFVDLLNHLLPNKIPIPGAPDINLPNNPIPHLQKGGRVPGSGRGDSVYALLEPGEHVVTTDEVAAAGGHGAIFALRRLLGGGGQGGGGHFQRGGRVAAAGGLTIEFEGGDLDAFQSQWRQFWTNLVVIARRGAQLIEKVFRDMRVATSRSVDRMYRDVRSSLNDIEHSIEARGKRIVDAWSSTWQSMKRVTQEGLFYIGHETNKVLTTLGENPLHFHLQPPKKADAERRQRGGMIAGYGDGDKVPVLAEPGEGFINKRAVRALGGAGAIEAINRMIPRFAQGGIVPIPGQPGESIHSSILGDVMKLVKTYKLTITDGYAPTGHAAGGEHPKGLAIDAVPGPRGSWNLIDRLAAWAEPTQDHPRKPFRWVGYTGDPGHGRGNHLHLSWLENAHLIGDFMTNIARRLVAGPGGGMKSIMQAALDKARKAANTLLDNKTMASTEGYEPGAKYPKGTLSQGEVQNTIRKALNILDITSKTALWVQTLTRQASRESTFNPNAVNNWDINAQRGDPSKGLIQIIGSNFAKYMVGGHGNIFNPLDNILAVIRYTIATYGGGNADRGVETLWARGGGAYEKGGIVPGPEGTPVPILAHAQEWILNNSQVNRLASLIGTSRSALRSMMGFYGGPGGAQGGTEVEVATPLTTPEVKGIDPRALRRVVVILRAIGRNIDSAAIGLGSVEAWSNYLDKSAAQLRRVTNRIKGRIDKGSNDKAFRGFLDGMDKLLGETGPFAKLRAAIERTSARAATRLARRTFAVSDTGVVTRRLNDVQVARQTLGQARDLREDLVAERGDIAGRLGQVRRQQRRKGLSPAAKQRLQAQENQLVGMLDEAETRITDNLQAIYDAQQALQEAKVARVQAVVDAINKRAEASTFGNELFRRIGEAIGDQGLIAQVNAAQRDTLQRQADELQGTLRAAQATGDTDLADQISQQISDLRVQIFESLQQELRDAADQINQRTQRRLGRLDLAGRMLDAIGAVGLDSFAAVAGQAFTRGSVFAERGGVLAQQRADLQGVLGQAQERGNIGLIQELTDQLAELEVAIRENTKAAFDARVEDVNRASSFSLNVNDLNKQITDLEGTIAGQTDTARLLQLAQERGNILTAQRAQLEGLLLEAQRMGNQQGVNDLTVALLENKVAILQNTQSINELNGTVANPQTFTSSAWTRFREAIFTGMGQVLPQFNPVNMMDTSVGGGVIQPTTLRSSNRISGDTNINLYEAGRPIDLQEISSAVTFASKTSQ